MNSAILTGLMSIGCAPIDASYNRMAFAEPRVFESCRRGVSAVFVSSGLDQTVLEEEKKLEKTGHDFIMETFDIKTLEVMSGIFLVSRFALGGEISFQIVKNVNFIGRRDSAEIALKINF